ncbi:MAG: hypothetical protein ACKVT0_23845 [Planctomycetaceae bacterium]
MLEWRVEQLRLTLFTASDYLAQRPAWWRQISGADPAETKLLRGISVVDSGPVQDGYCQLTVDLKVRRVDAVLSPIIKPTTDVPQGFPYFDGLDGAWQAFRNLLLPWATSVNDVVRIAVAAAVTAQVEDRISGYRLLLPLLPELRIDPEMSSDLSYQINRFTTSRVVEDLRVNRLSIWQVMQFHLMGIEGAGGHGPAVVRSVNDTVLASAARLQIDVNSDAYRTEVLPSGTIGPLSEELLALAGVICREGHIR